MPTPALPPLDDSLERGFRLRAEAARFVPAPPAVVWQVVADYGAHHLRIQPPAFRDAAVEAGGVGEGTVVGFALRLGGETRRFRAEVTVPVPGRVLEEADPAAGSRTRFTVAPDGGGSRVTIETTWPRPEDLRGRLAGPAARALTTALLRDELCRLDAYAVALARAAQPRPNAPAPAVPG